MREVQFNIEVHSGIVTLYGTDEYSQKKIEAAWSTKGFQDVWLDFIDQIHDQTLIPRLSQAVKEYFLKQAEGEALANDEWNKPIIVYENLSSSPKVRIVGVYRPDWANIDKPIPKLHQSVELSIENDMMNAPIWIKASDLKR